MLHEDAAKPIDVSLGCLLIALAPSLLHSFTPSLLHSNSLPHSSTPSLHSFTLAFDVVGCCCGRCWMRARD